MPTLSDWLLPTTTAALELWELQLPSVRMMLLRWLPTRYGLLCLQLLRNAFSRLILDCVFIQYTTDATWLHNLASSWGRSEKFIHLLPVHWFYLSLGTGRDKRLISTCFSNLLFSNIHFYNLRDNLLLIYCWIGELCIHCVVISFWSVDHGILWA